MTDSNEHTAASEPMPGDDTRETVRVLEIAAVQIETSLRESGAAIEDMICAITSMSANIRDMGQRLDDSGCADSACAAGRQIRAVCHRAEEDMQKAVMAFQFYDRLTQRMSHVRENLESLAEVILSPTREHPKLWKQLQQRARSVYSLEQERQMYNALINGLSIADVFDEDSTSKQDAGSDIELF